MNVTRVLTDILLVLLAAKVATELAERAGVPAVIGEIVAGVIIGPSALHLIGNDDVVRVLGELGVIMLLLDVGMEMDLAELGAVGRAALSVATVGVAVPFALGASVALGLGMTGKQAVFVGAALTATSVGITARVFGDLRALATIEARTVLGAAVADDVIGLVILTVVTRLATAGSISLNSVTSIVIVAIGFLVVASLVGIRIAPAIFKSVNKHARSTGTLVALSVVFALAIAQLADRARLAPIVGAFVAGLALGRGPAAPRIRRELAPLGHVLVPIFFVQIGLDAQIREFASGRVLWTAAVLFAVAVVGKLASVAGMWRAPGDRLLVGLGMIPRGEVGLIFATLGLTQAIFGRDIYAALLLVVLASTVVTPPLLSWRVARIAAAREAGTVTDDEPPDGWLIETTESHGHVVELAATPPSELAVAIGLRAAVAVAHGARAGDRLVGWLTGLPEQPLGWSDDARAELSELLAANDPRGWRFVLVTGLLDRCLPELAHALRTRMNDPFESDPTRSLSWPRLERLAERRPERTPTDSVLLAALVLDASELIGADEAFSTQLLSRLELPAAEREAVIELTRAATIIPAAAKRLDGLDDEPVLQLAGRLGSTVVARDAFSLAEVAADSRDTPRLVQLRDLVFGALQSPEHSGALDGRIVDERRASATELAPHAAARIAATPSAFVLSQRPQDLARQTTLAEPPLARRCVRALVTPIESQLWRVDVAVHDEIGMLARQLELLATLGYEVVDVATVVWPDRQSLSTFRIRGERRPSDDALADAIAGSIPTPVTPLACAGVELDFDDKSSPWHTICTVRTEDRSRALLAVAKALALADVNVVAARATTINDGPVEILELVPRRGTHLTDAARERVRAILRTGSTPTLRRPLRRDRPA